MYLSKTANGLFARCSRDGDINVANELELIGQNN